MSVVHVKTTEEFNQLIKSTNFDATIVDFSATWCGPCKMIAPYFEELAQSNKTIQFLKVDVDELSDVSSSAGVTAMPTFFVYKNGEKTDKSLRGANKDGLLDLVKNASSAQPVSESKKEEQAPKKSHCNVL